MRSLLSTAGKVSSWYRAQAPAAPGSKARFAPFGICVYEDEAAALRAVRLLGRVQIELPRPSASPPAASEPERKRARTQSRAADAVAVGGVSDDGTPPKRSCSLCVRMDSRFAPTGVGDGGAQPAQPPQGAADTETESGTGNAEDGVDDGSANTSQVPAPSAARNVDPKVEPQIADDDAKTLDLMQKVLKRDTTASFAGGFAEAEYGPLDSDGEWESDAAYATLFGCEPKTGLDAAHPLNDVVKFRRTQLRRGIELERWRLKQVRRCVGEAKARIRARQTQERRQSMEQHVGAQLAQIAPAAVPADTCDTKGTPQEEPLPQQRTDKSVTKADLFGTAINWSAIDQSNVTHRVVRPWVVQQITAYLGEAEKTLIDFVMQQLAKHSAATEIERELAMVLEANEAERFVIQLWRILVENS